MYLLVPWWTNISMRITNSWYYSTLGNIQVPKPGTWDSWLKPMHSSSLEITKAWGIKAIGNAKCSDHLNRPRWIWFVCVHSVYNLIWKLQCFKIVLMEIFGLYHLNTFNLFKASCHCFKNCFIAIIVFCHSFVYIAFTKAQIWLVCVQILALFRAWQRVNNTHETLDNSFHCRSVSFIKWICCRWSLRTVILKLGVRWQKKGDFQILFPLMACSQRCNW